MKTNHSISLHHSQIHIDSTSTPLIGGEIHQWRITPANWERCLDRVVELGARVIAIYVPWEHHELAPGEYDFTGRTLPSRNLLGFLDLARERGLKLFMRCGPKIYAEWVNGGVPDDVATHHRFTSHFRSRAQQWIKAAAEVLIPYLATRGGPIVLWQADNEIATSFDRELGWHDKPGLFQEFLHKRYASDAALQEAWENPAITRATARPSVGTMKTSGSLRQHRDTIAFEHWFNTTFAAWCIEQWREAGVDVPMVLNVLRGTHRQDWKQFEEISDGAGIDFYGSNRLERMPSEFRVWIETVRYGRAMLRNPYAAELQCGVWHGWHTTTGCFTPDHYPYQLVSGMAAGLQGFNYYMLVNRDNWYMAPINEWGRTRPTEYNALKGCFTLAEKARPWDWSNKASFSVLFDDDLEYFWGRYSDPQPVLESLFKLGWDYNFWEPRCGDLKHRVLVYNTNNLCSRERQEALREFVSEGGQLVCFQSMPVRDDCDRPLNLLGLPLPSGSWRAGGRKLLSADGREQLEAPLTWHWQGVEGSESWLTGPEPMQIQEEQKLSEAAVENIPLAVYQRVNIGKGSVHLWGVPATPNNIETAFRRLDAVPEFRPASGAAQGALLFEQETEAGERRVAAINTRAETASFEIHCPCGIPAGSELPALLGRGKLVSIGEGKAMVTLPPRTGEFFTLPKKS